MKVGPVAYNKHVEYGFRKINFISLQFELAKRFRLAETCNSIKMNSEQGHRLVERM